MHKNFQYLYIKITNISNSVLSNDEVWILWTVKYTPHNVTYGVTLADIRDAHDRWRCLRRHGHVIWK